MEQSGKFLIPKVQGQSMVTYYILSVGLDWVVSEKFGLLQIS